VSIIYFFSVYECKTLNPLVYSRGQSVCFIERLRAPRWGVAVVSTNSLYTVHVSTQNAVRCLFVWEDKP